MDKRLKDIQQGTLTESRLNSDFLFWLKEKGDRKSTRLNSSHVSEFRMPSSA